MYSLSTVYLSIIDRIALAKVNNALGSVHLFVCLFVCALPLEEFDLGPCLPSGLEQRMVITSLSIQTIILAHRISKITSRHKKMLKINIGLTDQPCNNEINVVAYCDSNLYSKL